ncbi:MAG: sigma-70 family RNA polymerase sigma factor [Egibacteraceae bacterium]
MQQAGQQTDRSGFTAVAREQLPWLYSLARRLVGDQAEDAVQECLIKAYRAYDKLRDEQAAPAWFRQILLNCIRDRYRKESGLPVEDSIDDMSEHSLYRQIADADPLPYSDSVHLDFLAAFEQAHVWEVLDRIKALYRVPLVLVHMEGFSTAQVARMFGVARGTVLSWLHRGRKLFERELWDYATEHDLLAAGKGSRAMISCAEAVGQLWEYLEHEVDDADRGQVEEHLAFCRRCCGEAEFAEALRDFLRSAARPHLPGDVANRLVGFLDELKEST